MKERSLWDRSYLLLKGIAMGTVNKIPGVSGGLVALIGGFYEELIFTFQKFNFKALFLLLTGRWRSFYRYTNFQFLLWLMTGVVISYFSTALILDALLVYSEISVWACFFGMILASLYCIRPKVEKWTPTIHGILLSGFLLGLLVSFSDPIPENNNLLYVFFCGIVSVCGMTLPVNDIGILVWSLLRGEFDVFQMTAHSESIKIVLAFVLGSLIGLILFSNLLSYLLRNYKNQTLCFIFGFIVGALRSVWPWKNKIYQLTIDGTTLLNAGGKPKIEAFETYWPSLNEKSTWISLFFIFVGGFFVIALEWYGKIQTQRYKTPRSSR